MIITPEIISLLNISSQIITIIGVPFAIFVFVNESKIRKEERKYTSYNGLDDRYMEIQKICLKHPELDIFDTPKITPPKLTDDQYKQEEAILLIRISIFEAAFREFTYRNHDLALTQWPGWELEIIEWMDRDNFKKVWDEHHVYFDESFADYFNKKFQEIQPTIEYTYMKIEIANQIVKSLNENFPQNETHIKTKEDLMKYAGDDQVKVTVAKINNIFIGCFIVETLPVKDEQLNLLSYLWIEKSEQGRGLGRKLVEHIKTKYQNIYLESSDKNLNFYKNLGFVKAVDLYQLPQYNEAGSVKYKSGEVVSKDYNLLRIGKEMPNPSAVIYENSYNIPQNKIPN